MLILTDSNSNNCRKFNFASILKAEYTAGISLKGICSTNCLFFPVDSSCQAKDSWPLAATESYEYVIQTEAQVSPLKYAEKQFIVPTQRFTLKKKENQVIAEISFLY